MRDRAFSSLVSVVVYHVGLSRSQPRFDSWTGRSFFLMTRVVKIQRRHGQVVQDCDIYIGRRVARGGWDLPASKWANPFSVTACGGSVEKAVTLYEEYLLNSPTLLACLPELRGKVLGCWCKPGPCHGDVLVRLVSQMQE
jgi:uncharacterized protein DUF4326